MWYIKEIDSKQFLIFNDGINSFGVLNEPSDHHIYQKYLQWVSEGNEVQEWTGE